MEYYNERTKRASLKYQAKNIRQIALRLNRNTDADVIEWLETQPSINGYLKNLIRLDMRFNYVSKHKETP